MIKLLYNTSQNQFLLEKPKASLCCLEKGEQSTSLSGKESFSKEVVIGSRYLNCSEIFILSNRTLKLTKNSWCFQNCALHLWLSAAVRRQQVASRETCQNQSRLRFHLPQTPLSGNPQPQAVQSHIRQVPRGEFVSKLP